LDVFIVYEVCFYYLFFSYFYNDDYMFGDLNIIPFFLLVLKFVVSIMFLIASPNVISILLGWDGLG